MTTTKKVSVVYGNGQAKKHSVRYAPLSAPLSIDVEKIGDVYVSRDVLDEIGARDDSRVRITYALDDEAPNAKA